MAGIQAALFVPGSDRGNGCGIHAAAHKLPQVRLLGGRHADFNLAPADTAHKGTALQRYLSQLGRDAALYIGDDRTDEDVFGLDLPNLIAVRVGRRRNLLDPFFMHDQSQVDRLQTLGELSSAL